MRQKPWDRRRAKDRERQIDADASRHSRKGPVQLDATGPEWNRSAQQHDPRYAGRSNTERFDLILVN